MSGRTVASRRDRTSRAVSRDQLPLYANPFRQLVSASTWRASWYLLAYLGVGTVLFCIVLTALTATAGLAITLAGLPLLIVTGAVIRGCATSERVRLRQLVRAPLTGGYRDTAVPGVLRQVRVAWTDPATWRNVAYLIGLYPFLWAVDLTVLTILLAFIGCVALPAWYWLPWQKYPSGTIHGAQFGYFPHGPHGPGAYGIYVDTLPKAIGMALVFLVLTLLFQYVVVLTARMHARVAYALLRAPEDPLAEAKDVLDHPGPLGPLSNPRRNGNSSRSAPVT